MTAPTAAERLRILVNGKFKRGLASEESPAAIRAADISSVARRHNGAPAGKYSFYFNQ